MRLRLKIALLGEEFFNGIKSAGQTNSDYLLNKYYQNALSAMSNKYSGVAENDPNFNKLVMEEAERLRDENLESFNNLEKAVLVCYFCKIFQ